MVYLLEINPLWLIDEGRTFATPLCINRPGIWPLLDKSLLKKDHAIRHPETGSSMVFLMSAAQRTKTPTSPASQASLVGRSSP